MSQNMTFSKYKKLNPVASLTVTAMSIAIGTALAIMSKQLFGNLPIRLDLSVMAVLLMSLFFGFPGGTITIVAIDVLSSVFFYPPFLPITFCKALTGLLFDFFLAKNRENRTKTFCLFLLNAIVIDCVLMAIALYKLNGGSIISMMFLRVGSGVMNIGLFWLFLYGIYPKLENPLKRILSRKEGGR